MRLDKYLVENQFIKSRTQAKNQIKAGDVLVNDDVVFDVNYDVKPNDKIIVCNNNKQYVSRAAYKLLKAIEEFNLDFKNKNILDIGSSTGGFVQVCLENDANFIYANDVGTNQLDESLRNEENIKVLENLNFKDVNNSYFEHNIDFITCDVSFISSKIILKKIKELFNKVKIIILLKPQFEFGKELTNKYKGFVPIKYHQKIIDEYQKFCLDEGFKILGFCESPILGNKLKNQEYLLYLELNHGQ